jgi:hypothetical protein
MGTLSSAEMTSGTQQLCIARMLNSIALQTIKATTDLQTAELELRGLVESVPADYLVFRRDTGRVVAKASPVGTAIELVLELSADTHIRRRELARDSSAFDTATGAISAYGKVLGLLSKFQQGRAPALRDSGATTEGANAR